MNRFSLVRLLCVVALVVAPSTAALAHGGKCGKGRPHKHDIVKTAVEAGSFNTLAAALDAAGLVETLKGKGPFTVFGPTDETFGKLSEGTLEN